MGMGFLDGEHPVGTSPDQIDLSSMLQAPSTDIFAYRIRATMPGPSGGVRIDSSVCFASWELMIRLAPAKCRAVDVPVTRLERVNFIDQGATPDSPVRSADPKDKKQYAIAIGNSPRVLLRLSD